MSGMRPRVHGFGNIEVRTGATQDSSDPYPISYDPISGAPLPRTDSAVTTIAYGIDTLYDREEYLTAAQSMTRYVTDNTKSREVRRAVEEIYRGLEKDTDSCRAAGEFYHRAQRNARQMLSTLEKGCQALGMNPQAHSTALAWWRNLARGTLTRDERIWTQKTSIEASQRDREHRSSVRDGIPAPSYIQRFDYDHSYMAPPEPAHHYNVRCSAPSFAPYYPPIQSFGYGPSRRGSAPRALVYRYE